MSAKPKLSDRELLSAVHHTLKDEGCLLPNTADEMKVLEEEFGKFPESNLNPSDAIDLARQQNHGTGQQKEPEDEQFGQFISQEFGLAARKGSAIPEKMWEKMQEDRGKSEKKHDDEQPC